MKHSQVLIVMGCMSLMLSCGTTRPSQLQHTERPPAARIVVAAATGTADTENRDESFREAVDNTKRPDRPYHFGRQLPPLESVQEAWNAGIHVWGPFVYTVNPVTEKAAEKEEGERREILRKENISAPYYSSDNRTAASGHEYYVQVGSWKNLNYAQEFFIQLKKHYPSVTLVEHNDFYKVRITGITSKKKGAHIAQHIEETFSLNPLLVLKERKTSLDDAVRPFIGTSYAEIDCYGLIVRGLMNQGIQYRGQGGIAEKLENLALHNGLPDNAYLNGEGLVEKAGTKIYANSILRVINVQEETDKIYNRIIQYLREGIILSFSTTTRGHTGIVSRWKDHWTYINSGVIDNPVISGAVSEKVGEEFLRDEIKNWVELASDREEPLTVTLGEIREERAPDYEWSGNSNKLTARNIY